MQVMVGDVIGFNRVAIVTTEEILHPYCTVGEIIERRKARGDWERCDFAPPRFHKI